MRKTPTLFFGGDVRVRIAYIYGYWNTEEVNVESVRD